MHGILGQAIISFLSVAIGLFLLWSIMRVMPPGPRAAHAALAGVVSAAATAIVTATVVAV